MCQVVGRNDGCSEGVGTRLRRYASVADAIAAASRVAYDNPHCQGSHVVGWKTGVALRARCSDGTYLMRVPRFGVEIFDRRVRRGLAEELAECYPREPISPPVEFWPIAGGGLNAPLGAPRVPVEGM